LHDRTCILVSAFEGYIAAAQLTRRLIDRYWRDHPPLLLCGASIDDEAALPPRGDPRDWMAGVRNGLNDLEKMGFDFVYLILADLGPLERCHALHLNRTIPGWMAELDAVYISIRGWDHRRHSSGRSLGQRYLSLQQQSPDYLWRFALHPALWRIDALAKILDVLMTRCADHSAWTCETEAGNLHSELPNGWNERTYRVCGRCMSAEPIPNVEHWLRHGIDGFIRWADKSLNHADRREAPHPFVAKIFQQLLRTESVYFQGPYPVYFRGFYTAGRVNKHLARFLARSGRHDLLSEIETACPRRAARPMLDAPPNEEQRP